MLLDAASGAVLRVLKGAQPMSHQPLLGLRLAGLHCHSVQRKPIDLHCTPHGAGGMLRVSAPNAQTCPRLHSLMCSRPDWGPLGLETCGTLIPSTPSLHARGQATAMRSSPGCCSPTRHRARLRKGAGLPAL